jgi:hypothetical protein
MPPRAVKCLLMASDRPGSPEIADHALQAAFAFVSRGLVVLTPGEADQRATENGSGIVVRTPGNKLVILTVQHLFEDAPPETQYRASYPECSDGEVYDVAERVIRPNDSELDVAIVVVRERARAGLERAAVPVSNVAAADDGEVTEKQWCVVAGYPAIEELRDVDLPARRVRQTFGSVTALCVPNGRDPKGLLRVDWQDGTIHSAASEAKRYPDRNVGSTELLPEPHGMSGGVLWRFERAPLTEIWSPTTTGKVIAVQRSWIRNDRTLLLEPVSRWRRWFDSVLAEIDK